jgi:hypothetical protein
MWPRLPCWGTTQEHAQGLGQCDVADVSEGCDDQALLDTQVLKGVLKVDITDGDDDRVLVLTPVEADLGRGCQKQYRLSKQ